MRKQQEFEGKDLEEALQAASETLGIPEPDLDYQILEQGRRGLMGLGAKNVRILVMPPVSGSDESADELLGERKKPPRKPGRKPGRRAGRKPARPRQRRDAQPSKSDPGAPLTPEAESVQATVQKMLDLMGLDIRAQAEMADPGLCIHLDGPDRKMLVQKDGELISALQFLLNRMAHRAWPDTGRIHLSSNGQRRQRDEELIELAREVAQQVSGTGQAKRLHPMNAYERRLVHITVREFAELGSRSEGNGYTKRVKIYKVSNKLLT